MLCGEPDKFVTAPDQPGLSGKRKGRRVAEMVRIGADMRRAVRGVRGEPLADAPRLFGAVAIGSVEQGKPVPAGIAPVARGDDGVEAQSLGDRARRSEEHTSDLQSLMRHTY